MDSVCWLGVSDCGLQMEELLNLLGNELDALALVALAVGDLLLCSWLFFMLE